jgi:hypothetical protein
MITGVDPDGAAGGFEWAVTSILGAIALFAALSARKHHRKLLTQRDTEGLKPPPTAR